jgi:hypothetical protein
VLTTTVDGLWALQVLAGIEVVGPELGLRPILPSVETPQMALAHPVAAELRAKGVLDESGNVDTAVVEWLTVLSRRDIALFIAAHAPGDDPPAGVLLARFAQWWAVIERSEDLIRISGAGTSSAESAGNAVIAAQIERLCGTNTPAQLRPVTLDADEMLACVTSADALRTFLVDRRLDAEQLQLLTMAADPRQSAQAAIVALQSGVAGGRPMRTHIDESTVTIIDTPAGRIVAELVRSGGKRWMIIGPGAPSSIASAVNRMMRRLPANQEWHSYRKVV